VLNCTIDRYAYAFIAPRNDGRIVFQARDLARNETHSPNVSLDAEGGLRLHRCVYNHFLDSGRLDGTKGLTLTTAVDAPPGSGLGSSSALVVAICAAFRAVCAAPLGLYDLAHLAFEIERVRLRLSGGKQDQYSAAFGGVNFIEFLANDRVVVNPLRVEHAILNELESSLVVCFTGASRESDHIIRQQTANLERQALDALSAMHALKSRAFEMKEALLSGDMRRVAETLSASWHLKKMTAEAISSDHIEQLLEVGRRAGARAGKVSGAGGGGFIMFLVDPEDRLGLIANLNRAGGQAGPTHLTSRGVDTWQQPMPM
jgi:D-glycero-alpha-D-manno-heptose-7-phosphate kinase